jgi:hypothetical protein
LPRLGPFRVRVLLACMASYDPYFVTCMFLVPFVMVGSVFPFLFRERLVGEYEFGQGLIAPVLVVTAYHLLESTTNPDLQGGLLVSVIEAVE